MLLIPRLVRNLPHQKCGLDAIGGSYSLSAEKVADCAFWVARSADTPV
jgi:hypothetical protein